MLTPKEVAVLEGYFIRRAKVETGEAAFSGDSPPEQPTLEAWLAQRREFPEGFAESTPAKQFWRRGFPLWFAVAHYKADHRGCALVPYRAKVTA